MRIKKSIEYYSMRQHIHQADEVLTSKFDFFFVYKGLSVLIYVQWPIQPLDSCIDFFKKRNWTNQKCKTYSLKITIFQYIDQKDVLTQALKRKFIMRSFSIDF